MRKSLPVLFVLLAAVMVALPAAVEAGGGLIKTGDGPPKCSFDSNTPVLSPDGKWRLQDRKEIPKPEMVNGVWLCGGRQLFATDDRLTPDGTVVGPDGRVIGSYIRK